MTVNKLQLKNIREAMIEGMSPEQIIEVFGLDTEQLMDCINNEDILDQLEALEDYIPRAFDEQTED